MFVNVDFEIFGYYCPDAQIKFSIFVQKRFFYVFLNNPKSLFLLLFENEFDNVTKLFEDLDTATLVERGWLNDPHICLAVFEWHFLVATTTICDFSEPVHKQLNFSVVCGAWNYEGGRCGVEERIAVLLCRIKVAIVGLEGLYEISLGANSSDDFEVVENEGRAFLAETLIDSIVATEA